jgi:hypothetical protein
MIPLAYSTIGDPINKKKFEISSISSALQIQVKQVNDYGVLLLVNVVIFTEQIGLHQFNLAMESLGRLHKSKTEMARLFKRFGKEFNGVITWEDFENLLWIFFKHKSYSSKGSTVRKARSLASSDSSPFGDLVDEKDDTDEKNAEVDTSFDASAAEDGSYKLGHSQDENDCRAAASNFSSGSRHTNHHHHQHHSHEPRHHSNAHSENRLSAVVEETSSMRMTEEEENRLLNPAIRAALDSRASQDSNTAGSVSTNQSESKSPPSPRSPGRRQRFEDAEYRSPPQTPVVVTKELCTHDDLIKFTNELLTACSLGPDAGKVEALIAEGPGRMTEPETSRTYNVGSPGSDNSDLRTSKSTAGKVDANEN